MSRQESTYDSHSSSVSNMKTVARFIIDNLLFFYSCMQGEFFTEVSQPREIQINMQLWLRDHPAITEFNANFPSEERQPFIEMLRGSDEQLTPVFRLLRNGSFPEEKKEEKNKKEEILADVDCKIFTFLSEHEAVCQYLLSQIDIIKDDVMQYMQNISIIISRSPPSRNRKIVDDSDSDYEATPPFIPSPMMLFVPPGANEEDLVYADDVSGDEPEASCPASSSSPQPPLLGKRSSYVKEITATVKKPKVSVNIPHDTASAVVENKIGIFADEAKARSPEITDMLRSAPYELSIYLEGVTRGDYLQYADTTSRNISKPRAIYFWRKKKDETRRRYDLICAFVNTGRVPSKLAQHFEQLLTESPFTNPPQRESVTGYEVKHMIAKQCSPGGVIEKISFQLTYALIVFPDFTVQEFAKLRAVAQQYRAAAEQALKPVVTMRH